MGYRKKHIKGGTDGFRNEPFQVRSMINQRKRKSEMRTKVVLFSTAVLLVVILAVLAFKLNGLNMQDGSGNVAAADTD